MRALTLGFGTPSDERGCGPEAGMKRRTLRSCAGRCTATTDGGIGGRFVARDHSEARVMPIERATGPDG